MLVSEEEIKAVSERADLRLTETQVVGLTELLNGRRNDRAGFIRDASVYYELARPAQIIWDNWLNNRRKRMAEIAPIGLWANSVGYEGSLESSIRSYLAKGNETALPEAFLSLWHEFLWDDYEPEAYAAYRRLRPRIRPWPTCSMNMKNFWHKVQYVCERRRESVWPLWQFRARIDLERRRYKLKPLPEKIIVMLHRLVASKSSIEFKPSVGDEFSLLTAHGAKARITAVKGDKLKAIINGLIETDWFSFDEARQYLKLTE